MKKIQPVVDILKKISTVKVLHSYDCKDDSEVWKLKVAGIIHFGVPMTDEGQDDLKYILDCVEGANCQVLIQSGMLP
jgi:hypothetical protein